MTRIALGLFFIFFICSFATEWHFETIAPMQDSLELALDGDDIPHLAYKSQTHLKHAYLNGSNWQIEVVDGLNNVGDTCSIAIDNNDNIHIAYGCFYGANVLKYAFFDGTSWQVTILDWPFVGTPCSIAVDSGNNPHIAYRDYDNDQLKYAYFAGSSWYKTVIEPNLGVYATSIAIDDLEHTHIAYIKNGSEAKYAYLNGTNWQIYSIETGNFSNSDIGIAVDEQEHPHIVYSKEQSGILSLKYAFFNGSNWQISTITSDLQPSDSCSIDLDSQGHPNITYYSYSAANLMYAYNSGVTWVIQPVDLAGDVGLYNSIKINSLGNPRIGYYDSTNIALKYAWFGIVVGIELRSFEATSIPGGLRLNWNINDDDQQTEGFNLYYLSNNSITTEHKTVKKNWVRINQFPIVGENPYSYDFKAKPDTSYIFRLTALLSSGKEEELGTTNGIAVPSKIPFSLSPISPNPACNTITYTVHSDGSNPVTVNIFDLSGRVIREQNYSGLAEEAKLDQNISDLADGVYILCASSGSHQCSRRFVVSR